MPGVGGFASKARTSGRIRARSLATRRVVLKSGAISGMRARGSLRRRKDWMMMPFAKPARVLVQAGSVVYFAPTRMRVVMRPMAERVEG